MKVPMIRDIDESTVNSMSEAAFAQWRRESGAKIVCARGRYWEAKPRGFYHALHWLARMDTSEAAQPTAFTWGFRTTLRDQDKSLANGTMPVHLLSNVAQYDDSALNSKRRNKIKNCRKKVRIVEILSADLLHEQGFAVYSSARTRTGYGPQLTQDSYRNNIRKYFQPRRGFVMGGLIEGRLAGYICAYAVEQTAYVQNVCLHTDALPTSIGTGLVFELLQACRRNGNIQEMVYGLDTPEDQALTRYKEGMGFPVVHVPARVWFAPLLGTAIRLSNPHSYYRLTGQPVYSEG